MTVQRRVPAERVLEACLRKQGLPWITSFFLDLDTCDGHALRWRSHFRVQVEKANYNILHVGCFPFIKFHCTRAESARSLVLDNILINCLKAINCGVPQIVYGCISWLLITRQETILVDGQILTVSFLRQE